LSATTSNGLPAAFVTSTTQDGEPFKASIIYLNNNAYLLVGKSKSSAAFARDQTAINGTIDSFRPLTEAEKNSLKPLQIRTIIVTKGLTYAELAHESPLGQNAESYLRLINGQYNDGEPTPGRIIKIVR
jgi:predicted Zn-dependent protease